MTKISLKIPKLVIVDSITGRTHYLCYLAQKIARGSYQSNNFLVLPYPSRIRHSVYFPDLAYSKKFWQRMRRSEDLSIDSKFTRACFVEAKKLLPKTDLHQIHRSLNRMFIKNKKSFWNLFISRRILLADIAKIGKITVFLTEFGPRTGFDYIEKGKRVELLMTFRTDRPEADLLKNLMYGLIVVKYGKPNSSVEKWTETRSMVRLLLHETDLDDFIGRKSIELPPTKKNVIESKKYLEKLGFGARENIKIKDNKIYLGDKKISLILSPSEELLLRELIVNQGRVLSYDRIAEILWQKKADVKFSLWAITKLMQKLRNKLRTASASPFLISTIYGQGYIIW